MCLRSSPCVCPRAFVSPRPLVRLLVWESDCGVGGGGFSVDGASVAVRDGETVVCGAPTVNAGVDVYRCWAACDGGVECVGAGFAACAPVVGVCGDVALGLVHACALVCARARLFDHGLWRACVSWLFAGVLCARVGDPCVGDGAEGLAGAQGDGGGVSALCASVSSLVVVQGCVDGDSVVVVRVAIARIRVVCSVAHECVSCEGEHAIFGGHNGFACEHVGERLLFALDPRVDLLVGECYADGGEGLALVA